MQWRSVLEEKYSALPGITNLYDFNTSKVADDSVLKYRSACYGGSYQSKPLKKPHCSYECTDIPSYDLISPSLSDEKFRQLTEEHTGTSKLMLMVMYDHHSYVHMKMYLLLPARKSAVVRTVMVRPHSTWKKKRHFSEKYCPIAAKKAKS